MTVVSTLERPRDRHASSYRQCARCLMDTTDPEIVFDAEGNCNHCNDFITLVARNRQRDPERESRPTALIEEIRAAGRGRPYDCVIGVSGGVDSTYVAYLM